MIFCNQSKLFLQTRVLKALVFRALVPKTPGKPNCAAIIWMLSVMAVSLSASQSRGDSPARTDLHTQAYYNDLDLAQRSALSRSLQDSLRRRVSNGSEDSAPDYLRYQRVFLRMLMNPSITAGLSAEDRQLLDNLPAHNDPRFLKPAMNAMTSACRVIKKLSSRNPRAAVIAARHFSRARDQVQRRLDSHYQAVMTQLSLPARKLVHEELSRAVTGAALIHTEIDFDSLSFSAPAFILAFLRDACVNSTSALRADGTRAVTLKNQLNADLQNDAVNLYMPQ